MKVKARLAISIIAVLFCSNSFITNAELSIKDKVELYVNQEEISLLLTDKVKANAGYEVALEYSSFSRVGLDKN